jgi:catechol 2,3-dioxygenase-like lactoylglutathione lyase family enzyme
MRVNRIVTNIAANPERIAEAKRFYGGIFGLDLLMDLGWIATYGSKAKMTVQLSIMTEGGSGTPVPDLSIEVEDLDAALERVRNAGIAVVYGPATEVWNVRRFYVRDPFGKLVNVLQHL